MLVFALGRLVASVPTLLISSLGVFMILRLVPGDPALVIAGPDATPSVIEAVRHDMGLDRPAPVQYVVWLGHVLTGDLGRSYVNGLPVSELIARRISATTELAVAGILLALAIAVPLGVLAAVRPRGPADWFATGFSAFAVAIPNFWIGIVALLVFSLALGWLPPGGYLDPMRDPGLGLKFLLLPALTLALNQAAVLSRFVKSSLVEVLREDYMRTARAKGLSESRVLRRHALRNALVPVITVLGLQFGQLLGGAIIIEAVFAWPGIGQLILQAVQTRDYLVVQGVLLLLGGVFVGVNLLTDLAYGAIDPRIRLARAAP